MTSLQPYGTYVSLDGIHPSADGQRIIAEAAAAALDAKYGFGIARSALIASR
jgi:lysophospholipase L1-like esterase